ncbi:ribonuclease toxin immunity protein CdiI [Paenibacillus popilliae]|uniref:CDI immunity protein domain-containing protein n=1 Tax=Paenibacillus popilliae TaxID=78057 RepID=A0ABY3AIW0_PAEPP|nr:ribonuclease toxin immunity protein CdiI [Paenibacillus sp. SDF0028]TQR41457.1 hypothetical protein C7Y44_25930 [Paenibacillus sp. SDF0028]
MEYIMQDPQEKIRNMDAYYSTLGDGYFLDALNEFKHCKGFGIGYTSCYFATECIPNDEEYFGDSGVNFTTTPPVTSVDVYAIVEYEMFFDYLVKVSQDFVSRHPQHIEKIESCLAQVKEKLNL